MNVDVLGGDFFTTAEKDVTGFLKSIIPGLHGNYMGMDSIMGHIPGTPMPRSRTTDSAMGAVPSAMGAVPLPSALLKHSTGSRSVAVHVPTMNALHTVAAGVLHGAGHHQAVAQVSNIHSRIKAKLGSRVIKAKQGSRKARGNYHATVSRDRVSLMGGNSFCGLGSSGGSAGSAGSAGYAVSAGSAGSSGSSGNVLSSITSGLSSLASIAAPIISQISPQRAPALVIVKKKGLTIDGKTISPTMIVIGIGAVGVILFMVARSGKKHSAYSSPTTA